MSSENEHDNAPDSWDQELNDASGEGDQSEDINSELSDLKLNADAPVFVPGQNIHAVEFVPILGQDEPGPVSADETGAAAGDEAPPDIQDPGSGQADGSSSGNWDKYDGEREAIEADYPDDPEDEPPIRHKHVSESDTPQEHVNVVFIGHVDAGKSTIGGHIMYLTGMVDKRTLEKYEREAKEKNRETWYLSWALDTNLEEREKGKTVEVGRAYFETENKHFTILDAPGHKSFVPNMIGGASQADLAVLVISARKGEFETGFERGGQTREHAMLVKTAGVRHLVVVINKMDDPTVHWSEERYKECITKLAPYLRKCGFTKSDIFYMPVSGLNGSWLKEDPGEDVCPWYRGPSLIDYLDGLPSLNRSADMPFRMPIVDRYKDMGTIVLGKIESGIVSKNQSLLMMPNRTTIKVMNLWSDDEETDMANPGANVKLKVSGVEEEDVSPGFVLCIPENLCHTGKVFDAQIVILEHKSIICAGYSAVLHIHACAEEVTIKALLCLIDKRTGDKSKVKPRFIKQDQTGIARMEVNGGMICLETFKDFPQMGRFTLRDEGKTIAIGKVLKVLE